ncbi:HipA family kinase [Kineosporia mesophila]|uniref:HipA family kinase n=1 Tax=Kineosporia mesophila TaxID=566012 RepID=UPI001E2BDA60|nr:HipA family kinase [Kineosporia mesophila]MCD5351493.1 hypothetical protein [Kineosporia mesophila]
MLSADPHSWKYIPSPRPGAVKSRPQLVSIAEQNQRTGSGAFRGLTNDNQRWWIKPLNNTQDPRVTVTELIVSRAARLIGAPVCEASVIEIPEDLADEEFLPGVGLIPGLAFGSRHVDDVLEERALTHRREDDNRTRHAGVYALYDWCWGSDDQWLYQTSDDNRLFSHDHGQYLPGGPYWTVRRLEEEVNTPHVQACDPRGVDPSALRACAQRLDGLSGSDLGEVLAGIPSEWPVSDAELAAVGWFLERRAPAVSLRLQKMAESMGEE